MTKLSERWKEALIGGYVFDEPHLAGQQLLQELEMLEKALELACEDGNMSGAPHFWIDLAKKELENDKVE